MNHDSRVKSLQNELNNREGELCFSAGRASNCLRKRSKKGLDLSAFAHILDIQSDWAFVEPRVTFQQLCKETLKKGLIPPVVPEFSSITVGGAVMGAALESSSHRFGQVSDICLEYEVVLGNGECIRASADENSALFYGLSGSYGTLGVLTAIKIRLIPAQKYVCLTYQPLPVKELLTLLTSEHKEDFVEGIAFNHGKGIAITGNMSSHPKGPFFRQNRSWSPWYIQHLKQNHPVQETMYTQEYLFRLDRGAFWMGRYVLSIPTMLRLLMHIGIPKIHLRSLHPSLLFRLFFGWALSSKRLYGIWHRVPQEVSENLFFVHDFYTPAPKVEDVFAHFAQETQIFPIWLCPIKGTKTPQILAPHYGKEKFVNMGLYGIPQSPLSVPALTAELEKEIALYGGRKMLYSYTYYDRKTFDSIYDETAYSALRDTFFATKAFPHIHNKVVI
ncbi:MAG: hypothetical protein S4CHLAM2_05800 [Chlamydiales bacterium]|nr:hypothetical protein [Chlamydiales bacterium]